MHARFYESVTGKSCQSLHVKHNSSSQLRRGQPQSLTGAASKSPATAFRCRRKRSLQIEQAGKDYAKAMRLLIDRKAIGRVALMME